ncbi:MAG: sulfite exporter TauE/SafE family protein [Phycisphaerales bacterium]|nr:sulfite exporter TauE/SafE family protein [Phycisphaerales bacterium]
MPAIGAIGLLMLFIVVAALYSSVGHAGGSGYLAAMALMGVAPEVMKPASLSLNVLVATIATAQFARAGHFSWRLFWPFALAAAPMAFVGGAIMLPGAYYRPLIGAILLYSAWRLVFARGGASERNAEDVAREPRVAIALAVGAGLGLLSGLSGTGGGIFLSPILLLCGWATAKRTAAVSAAFILLNSISGLAGVLHSTRAVPEELVRWGWLWAIGAVAGGLVGSYFGAWRLAPLVLRRLLAVVLVVAGLKLVVPV